MNTPKDSHRPLFTFLSKINHDLRTPLTAMLNMVGLIKEDPGLHCTPRNLRLIQEAGEELKMLLQDVTDLAKLESGTLKLKPAPAGVRDLMKQIASKFEKEAADKGLAIHLEVEDDVPDQIVADHQRLQQVLAHLMSNAVQHTENGAIDLRVARGAAENAGSEWLRLHFSVEDSGAGIPPEAMEHLFDRFLYPEGDGLIKTGGSGLGLAVSKRLVHLMGGDLNVASVVGRGSTFGFDLPCREIKPTAAPANGQTAVNLGDLGKLRIMVVEDNFINLLSFSEMLERYGFEIQSASNGQQALDLLRDQTFDVVLMDVKMPVMDGLEATRRIRSSSDRRISGTKVVALTAYAMPEDRRRIMASGMDDIISKPIEVEELAGVLKRVLRA